MSKEAIVSEQKAAILAGQDAALEAGLEAVYDLALAEAPVGEGGGLSQADLDSAVAAAIAPLNDQIAVLIAKDEADVAAGQAALVDLQAKLDVLAEKEAIEAGIVDGLKGSLAVLQDVVSKLSGLGV